MYPWNKPPSAKTTVCSETEEGRLAVSKGLPVWGGCRSGRIRCWNDMAHTDSEPNHLSDVALT
jgi:hypothetical protein